MNQLIYMVSQYKAAKLLFEVACFVNCLNLVKLGSQVLQDLIKFVLFL